MRFKQKIIIALLSTTLIGPYAANTGLAYATSFTQSESSKIKNLQNQYANLPKMVFAKNNIYSKAPHLSSPFSAGILTDSYVSSQLAYINFYRSLFNLPAITTNPTDNDNAQVTASVMAAINANPFKNQHGLPNEKRPKYISKINWSIAKNVSASSNLNFNVSDQSAGDVITDLLTDSYNLDGSDTGHRAWLLSSRLTTTGIGAAYGSNGYRYSVQQVAYASDSFKAAAVPTVTYPASGIFPIELLKGKNIAWSLYLSDRTVLGKPTITITDLDTGQMVKATKVKNYSSGGYGNFATVLTYFPGNLNLVAGHSYSVKIKGVYNYTFKLYNLNTADETSAATTDNTESNKSTNSTDYNVTVPKVEDSKQSNASSSLNIDNSATSGENLTSSNKTAINFDNATQTENNDTSANNNNQIEDVVDIRPNLLLEGEKIRDGLSTSRLLNTSLFGRSYQDGKTYYNLGSNQWFRGFYITSNPQLNAGLVNVTQATIDRNIYSSPYDELRKVPITQLTPGKSYPYGQTITIGDTVWYYLGPHQWIRQPLSQTDNLI
ncbi:hypothetical protein J2Z60_000626 [Lactobacillus colini]|uniref:SCP domain-containing protein n=1 Tax=Lactobacillus colini TaxID=1819254 RepID=A0ABS4MCP8_9LACO|nr:CAP domain-containing protein [Lactobacillus colini]MBP2057462.1 hypothetical protein [Lactobacillus colini]